MSILKINIDKSETCHCGGLKVPSGLLFFREKSGKLWWVRWDTFDIWWFETWGTEKPWNKSQCQRGCSSSEPQRRCHDLVFATALKSQDRQPKHGAFLWWRFYQFTLYHSLGFVHFPSTFLTFSQMRVSIDFTIYCDILLLMCVI